MNQLEAQHLVLHRQQQPVLDRFSLQLHPGQLTGLIGPNGAGKSTLLNCLAGLIRPDRGEVLLDGIPLEQIDSRSRGRLLGYLAQQGEIHWPINVERLVQLGRTPHLSSWQQPDDSDRAAVEQAMQQTDTLTLAERCATELSGGEKSRVLLARLLAGEPRILLADEPVAALDPAHQLSVMQILQQFAHQGGTTLTVLHDLNLAARYCDRILMLHQGKLIADGPPSEVLTPANLQQVFGINALVMKHPEAGLNILLR